MIVNNFIHHFDSSSFNCQHALGIKMEYLLLIFRTECRGLNCFYRLDAGLLREIDTLAGEVLHLGQTKISTRPMNHRPESLAVRIEAPSGRSMVYSGDTDACPSLAALAQQTDLFICEAALPDEARTPGHLTPSLAAAAARDARVGHLVLTHLYPPCDEVDIAKQAAAVYKGQVTVARDLMVFDLG